MLKTILTLAQFAPTLFAFFKDNKQPKKTTEAVESIAKDVADADSVEAAIRVFKNDANKANEFKARIIEAEFALQVAYLEDMNSARARDSIFLTNGQRNYRADLLSFLAILIIIALVLLIWKSPELNEYVKGVFTLVLGRFMGYVDNIYNFEFGSTRSSKQKDSTINHLSEKE